MSLHGRYAVGAVAVAHEIIADEITSQRAISRSWVVDRILEKYDWPRGWVEDAVAKAFHDYNPVWRAKQGVK